MDPAHVPGTRAILRIHPHAVIADRFVLERPAGAGGMGVVYRALDRRTGSAVALKVAAPDEEHGFRDRVLVEADTLAALDHPAVVRLVAHGLTPEGAPFLAMEWLDGEDLAARLARASLTVRESLVLGARIADALVVAHARGVVHRDLKPSNLFLPGGDVAQVKLVDFGIARSTRALRRLTATGMLIGTPGYMAPELASAERDIGPPADLFSLGAVLFECLAGRHAFAGSSVMAVLARVLLDEPPRLDALRPGLSPILADLIAAMLAKSPGDRPAAVAVAAALSVLLRELDDATDPAAGPTSHARPAGEAISGEEQRLVCILLARPQPSLADAGAPIADADAPEGVQGPDVVTTLPADGAPPRSAFDTLARLRALVAPLGGRADGLLDGSLLASWLDPGVPRDQATRAARAALLARHRLPGAALVLTSGLTERRGALPLGPALDRAAALLDAAAALPDAVLLDDVTAGLLDARFELASAPAGAVLRAERAVDEEEARLLLGHPVPCVGRDRELRALADLLDECVDEPIARAALITAPPGIGKSRLRHELLRLVRLRGDVDVWAAHADQLGAGSPFALLGAALQRAVGARPGDPLDQRRRRLEDRVARSVPAPHRARVAAFLGEIAGAPFPAEAHPLLADARRAPLMMAEQVRRAWLDLLTAETAGRPLLLVLEDLHWGDLPSLQLIDAALAALRDRPLMVLGLARPEVHERFPDLWAGRDVQDLRLGPLPRRAAARLIRHALPDAGDALIEHLTERADGNAFYLEELLRAVVAGHGDALPDTIVATVQYRLDALTSEERRLLRAASVFGEVFWKRGALALLGEAGGPGPSVDRVDALVARELLVRRHESRFPGEEELAFRHGLIRDGAYAALSESDRARAHRRAAAWLEEAGEPDPLVLAAHRERGGEAARAAAHYLDAAQRARAANDLGCAITLAERALALALDEEGKLEAWMVLAEANWHAGHLDEAERWNLALLGAAPRGSGHWFRAVHVRSVLLIQRGSAEAIPFGIASMEGVEVTPENAGPFVLLGSSLAPLLALIGMRPLAEEYRRRVDAIAEAHVADLGPVERGLYHSHRASWWLYVETDLASALRDLDEALSRLEIAGERTHAGLVRSTRGLCLYLLGALERAEVELRSLIRESPTRAYAAMTARAVLAQALLARGALEEALREASAAAADAEEAADRLAGAIVQDALTRVLLRRGDLARAEREILAVLASSNQDPLMRSSLRVTLAEVRLAQGDAAEALSLIRAAAADGPAASSNQLMRLRSYPVEVEALAALGDRAAARARLSEGLREIEAIAAKIGEEELLTAFRTQSPLAAPLLRLAAGERPSA